MDPDDYSHKIEVNSDANPTQNVSNRNMNNVYKIRKEKIKLLKRTISNIIY